MCLCVPGVWREGRREFFSRQLCESGGGGGGEEGGDRCASDAYTRLLWGFKALCRGLGVVDVLKNTVVLL